MFTISSTTAGVAAYEGIFIPVLPIILDAHTLAVRSGTGRG